MNLRQGISITFEVKTRCSSNFLPPPPLDHFYQRKAQDNLASEISTRTINNCSTTDNRSSRNKTRSEEKGGANNQQRKKSTVLGGSLSPSSALVSMSGSDPSTSSGLHLSPDATGMRTGNTTTISTRNTRRSSL